MKEITVKTNVGYVSLVEILGKDFPLSYGNYFSLGNHHVINMWHENFKHLIKTGVIKTDTLKGMEFGFGIVLTDKQIPKDYLNERPCFTGSHGTIKDIKGIFKLMFPQYKDNECMCNEESEYVSVNINSWRAEEKGIQLSEGICYLCNRVVKMNNRREVSEEEYKKTMGKS